MRYSIQATNTDLTAAIRAYVEKRLAEIEKVLDMEDESIHAEVEVGKLTRHHKSGDVFFAEINLHAMKKRFRATEKTSDLYAAIDAVKDELLREVVSREKKTRVRDRKGARQAKAKLRKVS